MKVLKIMKNKITSVALVLAVALLALTGGGCVAANNTGNGIAKVFEAAARNTNSFRLDFNGWGATIHLEQNAVALAPAK